MSSLAGIPLFLKSSKSNLYRESDHCIVKTIADYHDRESKIAAYQNEYYVTKKIDVKGVRKAQSLEMENGNPILRLDFVEGVMLSEYIKNHVISIEDFLALATKITQVLVDIHRSNIIHKDINGHNILISPGGEVTVIDFELATIFNQQKEFSHNPENVAGTLTHISPEQTGRMNRTVDKRSDLYSLGVVFYEMLTGRLPFRSSDPLELVHAHIAKTPTPVHQIKPNIPEAISKLVSKLLMKNAEDRYHSAVGLAQDLTYLADHLEDTAVMRSFELGKLDFSDTLNLTEKLYGREKELDTLLKLFDRVAEGNKEIAFVRGYSGAGKSFLINEIHRPITIKNGLFLSGKFDQLNKELPYQAIIQALERLATNLITESDQVILEWKQQITTALGDAGKVLTNLIPQFELIIGNQAEIPDLDATAARLRIQFVIKKLIGLFATKAHPLVFVIDDVQWADGATINLINEIVLDVDIDHLLLICSYRDNEVTDIHPFGMLKQKINNTVATTDIDVPPLKKEFVEKMVKEALTGNAAVDDQVIDIIYEKTLGNAFFVKQFLISIWQDKYLRFDPASLSWTCDLETIRGLDFTGNVIDLMTKEVKSLPATSLDTLKAAAVIGNRFNLENLHQALSYSPEEIAESLNINIIKGYITPYKHSKLYIDASSQKQSYEYKFTHDKIQEACLKLLTAEETKNINYRIGSYLLSQPDSGGKYLFDIVNYLNNATELLSKEQRKQLVELNFTAATKARNSAANENAFNFLKAGEKMLGSANWQSDYQLMLKYHDMLAEVNFLVGNHEGMHSHINQVFENAKGILDKIKCYRAKIDYYSSKHDLGNIVKTGLQAIRELGIQVPKKPTTLHVLAELLKVHIALKGRKVEDLINLPRMTDPKVIAATSLITGIGPAAMYSFPELMGVLAVRSVYLAIRHGIGDETAFNITGYAMVISASLRNPKLGNRYGELALKIAAQYENPANKTKAILLYNNSVGHWVKPFKTFISPLEKNYNLSLEVGNFEYAFYSLVNHLYMKFFCSYPLQELSAETTRYAEGTKHYNHDLTFYHARSYQTFLINLTAVEAKLDGVMRASFYDDEALNQLFRQRNDKANIVLQHYYKAVLAYLGNHHENALKFIDIAQANKDGFISQIVTNKLNIYQALIYTDQYIQTGSGLRQAKKAIKELAFLAKTCQENFAIPSLMCQAHLASATQQKEQAVELFTQAIKLAEEQKFLHEKALSLELLARHYIRHKQDFIAKSILKESWETYQSWGASSKVQQMFEQYPELLNQSARLDAVRTTPLRSGSQRDFDSLDMNTIIKVSNALTEEIKLDKLLQKLMALLIENAGAEKGVLVLKIDDEWFIQAVGDIENSVEVLNNINIRDTKRAEEILPLSILNYVLRSQNTEVVADALVSKYEDARYIKQHSVRSILCLPLINKTQINGAVYLENNKNSGVFHRDLVNILQIVSSQISVSLDNALLYDSLEEKVKLRTQEVMSQKEIIEQNNQNILSSIRYAQRIQSAMLPQNQLVNDSFSQAGILFKPKDIVSGDFYYFAEKNGKQIIAAVDCTGHGVPGGFMSMVGNALLNQIIYEKDILQADLILQELDRDIIQFLKQDTTDNKDGMDMALCVFDKKKKKVQFAGAKNPLFLIQHGQPNLIKASKAPIGGGGTRYGKLKQYEMQEFDFVENMRLYLFSDGYQDQFGGQDRRKFYRKNLLKLLMENHQLPMQKQSEIWNLEIENWKGKTPQTDDILIIGIKI